MQPTTTWLLQGLWLIRKYQEVPSQASLYGGRSCFQMPVFCRHHDDASKAHLKHLLVQ